MLIHRKNWCRVCGICLTCPRSKRSLFHQGRCCCEERQINHVSSTKVKGNMLFSFRYRHLSADDIDTLEELRPKFNFATPPIERCLVRANICSTCQQRLRRARLAKQKGNALNMDLERMKSRFDSYASHSTCFSGALQPKSGIPAEREPKISCQTNSALFEKHLHNVLTTTVSALRSTLAYCPDSQSNGKDIANMGSTHIDSLKKSCHVGFHSTTTISPGQAGFHCLKEPEDTIPNNDSCFKDQTDISSLCNSNSSDAELDTTRVNLSDNNESSISVEENLAPTYQTQPATLASVASPHCPPSRHSVLSQQNSHHSKRESCYWQSQRQVGRLCSLHNR